MSIPPLILLPELARTVDALTATSTEIPETRRLLLRELSAYVQEHGNGTVRLNFICTHNSRRSQLAMAWAAVAAAHHGFTGVQTFSGGTEVTAFFPAAVRALERAGFRQANYPSDGANPHYHLRYSADAPALSGYSKRFDDAVNPDRGFAAVMTCSDADAGCPLIPGADRRISLPYDDPKSSDGTAFMDACYDTRSAQIGRELLYVFASAASQFSQQPEP